MGYEGVLLFAVAFFAAWVFYFASGGADTTRPGTARLGLRRPDTARSSQRPRPTVSGASATKTALTVFACSRERPFAAV